MIKFSINFLKQSISLQQLPAVTVYFFLSSKPSSTNPKDENKSLSLLMKALYISFGIFLFPAEQPSHIPLKIFAILLQNVSS